MKLDAILSWYQKKIGTYDKQQWEKTVEQKILSGLTSITLKNAKLKTELIDVDLVRGSTFPKAKPKQSLWTVIKFAILRYFFLPLYAKWWVSQTSPKTFVILLCLYISQLFNWAAYSYHIHRIESEKEHILSLLELVLPVALSLILSFIHSQIVATSGVNATTKPKRVLATSGKSREPIRRRKKLVKMRSTESDNGCLTKTRSRSSNGIFSNQNLNTASNYSISTEDKSTEIVINAAEAREQSIIELKVETNQNDSKSGLEVQSEDSLNSRKRNVNWDSPIHNFATESIADAKPSPQNSEIVVRNSPKSKTVRIDDCIQEFYEDLIQYADDGIAREYIGPNNNPNVAEQTGEDDGFESLNGKSSSGEETPMRGGLNADQENSRLEQLPVNEPPVVLQNPIQVRRRLPASKSSTTFKTGASDDERLSKAKSDLNDVVGKKMFSGGLPGFRKRFPLSSESDADRSNKIYQKSLSQAEALHKKCIPCRSKESSDTDEEGDDGEVISSPVSIGNANYTECTTSATEWLGITTNSEECSYSSEFENSDFQPNHSDDGIDHDFASTVILNPSCGSSDRISCTIWEHRDVKKAELSVLDISSCIIERVEDMPETCDYLYIGVAFSVFLSLMPIIYRLCEATELDNSGDINYLDIPLLLWEKASFSSVTLCRFALGETTWEQTVVIIAFLQRLSLTFTLFFLFAVAERTFKQRFLYAKLFSHLTSSRRAQKSNLPHFRLNKVRNIKTWLSVRSYLKRRGPQRSVEVIVSSAFIITLLLLAFLSVEWMKDSVQVHSQLNLEALLWSTALGIFLLRFMTLGNKINRKYRCISVLITEQINLYLQIEQKPKKKEELMVSNSVLKLAADLLKELESPFKISGLSANPYLYTIIKVVMLSALSGVLSEMLGFKLKLHKIKIK